MEKDKKYIKMDVSCHLSGRCKVPKCEGQYLVAITPEQKAQTKINDVSLGVQTATCGHKAEIVGTF